MQKNKKIMGFFLIFTPMFYFGCGENQGKIQTAVENKEESIPLVQEKEPQEIKVEILLKDPIKETRDSEEHQKETLAPAVNEKAEFENTSWPVQNNQLNRNIPSQCLDKSYARAPMCTSYYNDSGELLNQPLGGINPGIPGIGGVGGFGGFPFPDAAIGAPWPIFEDIFVEDDDGDDDFQDRRDCRDHRDDGKKCDHHHKHKKNCNKHCDRDDDDDDDKDEDEEPLQTKKKSNR